MKFNDKFFRDIMRDKRISVRKLAGLLGMNHHSQLSLMFGGKRRMQLDEAIALSKILSLPLNSVIANAGFPEILQGGKRLPVVGILRGNGEVEDVPPNTERVVSPSECPDVVSAVQARTRDTPLSWMDRFVMFIGEKGKPIACTERLSYCELSGGRHVISTIMRGYKPDSFNLIGPYSKESVKLISASPILWIRP